MRAILYGKGPGFDPARQFAEDVEEGTLHIGCNEAGLALRDGWTVFGDAHYFAKNCHEWKYSAANFWVAPEGIPEGVKPGVDLLYKPMTLERDRAILERTRDATWEETPVELWARGYTSTVALHLAWLLGADEVELCGIGGAEGYHPSFKGEPGNPAEAREALGFLREVAGVLGVSILHNDQSEAQPCNENI